MTNDVVPGVYVEELGLGPKAIEGVPTSTAAFLGETERGPLRPHLVTSWREYVRLYGEFAIAPRADVSPGSQALPLAVLAFFENGGQRVYIARIVKAPVDDGGSVRGALPSAVGGLRYVAKGPGSWSERVHLQFLPARSGDARRFRLRAWYWSQPIDLSDVPRALSADEQERAELPAPAVVEEFDELDVDSQSPQFAVTRINTGSVLVAVLHDPTAGPFEVPRPSGYLQLANGEDGGALELADFRGAAEEREPLGESWGLTALEEPAYDDVAIVYAPRALEVEGLVEALTTHCETHGFRFLVIDSPPEVEDVAALDPRAGPQTRATANAAFYFPWYWTVRPGSSERIKLPPGGAVVGIYARSDVERGVWKAPANEVVRGAVDLELDVTKAQQDVLNPRGVNVVRRFEGRGIRVWGARTLSNDSVWRYVNVRRLALFLLASLARGLSWVVFEPNDERTWARVVASVSAFLRAQWRAGALPGIQEDEAFFVKADRTTMTRDDIDHGRLIVLVGIAPLKPAEFVVLRIGYSTAGADA